MLQVLKKVDYKRIHIRNTERKLERNTLGKLGTFVGEREKEVCSGIQVLGLNPRTTRGHHRTCQSHWTVSPQLIAGRNTVARF